MNLELTEKMLTATFFDQQPQPAFWMTPVWNDAEDTIIDFTYNYCNREFFIYLGLEPQKVIGSRVYNSPAIADPAAREKLFREILNVYQNGQRMQAWLYNPDIKKYYSYTRNRVEDGVLTVLQDRTEEFRMMQELEQQKTLMDNILKRSSNAITVGAMVRDASGKIVDIRTILVNDAAIRFTGILRERYLSMAASELDPNFLNSPYHQLCLQVMETGEPALSQYYLEEAGQWLEVSISKMDADHQIYIFTNVTPIKEAQLALERSAKQLEAIINRTQSGIFTAIPVFDGGNSINDFQFVLVNQAVASYVDVLPQDLPGKNVGAWFPAYRENGLLEIFRETYLLHTTKRTDFHYHDENIDAWIDVLCTRFEDVLLVTFADYTPVKKLQIETETLVRALQRSNASLEEFAHAASHDLQEPLRKIQTFTERLQGSLGEGLDPAQESLFERIMRASRRMSKLVADLLTLSQVSFSVRDKEPVDLNEKLQQILGDLELTIEEKGAVITLEPLPVIQGHRLQLQQLFYNLLTNALKYSREDELPRIQISSRFVKGADYPQQVPQAREKEAFYLIEVQDNGIGFDQEYAIRIFEMFQRLHGKEEYSGTGIGLSIAQRVVINHSGYIWATGMPGAGALFHILLPVEHPMPA